MPPEWELFVRLIVAALLGGAVGLEREISDQPAGFRTHMLVALGSCLFAVVSAYGFESFAGRPATQIDPSRVAAQIVSGIGFLGAGAIIRYGMSVRGLTTAASLWVVAAVGMAVALGGYSTAVVTSGVTILALWALKRIRPRLVRGLKVEHEEVILEAAREVRLEDIVRAVSQAGIQIDHLRVEEEEDGRSRSIALFVTLPHGMRPEEAITLLDGIAGVRNVDWTR